MVECLTRDQGFKPHRHHCVVSLSKNFNPSLVLVQPRKTRPLITERLLMGRKESNLKLPFVIKIFVLSIFEWPLYIDFTVYEGTNS